MTTTAPPRVVIIGMGDTGVLVATHLGRSVEVVGISTRPALVSGQELGTRLADPDAWRRNYLTPLNRFRRLDRVKVIHGRVRRVDPVDHLVDVDAADGHRTVVRYDVLVIASGVRNGFWRDDRIEGLAAIEAGLDDTASQLREAGSIAIIGGGPTGVSAAVNLARADPTTAVHLFFSQDEPLPGYHARVRRAVVRELTAAGVGLHPGHRAAVPDGFETDRLTTDPVEWTSGQAPFDADVVLWATGRVRPHSAFLPSAMLDTDGFVEVDEHLRVPGFPDVFAVGDVAATDAHRSSARNFGYRIVCRNVRAVLAGRTDRLARFEAPEHRWGSILGMQEDGMVVYQPNGSRFRVPRWAAQPLLMDVITKAGIYGGVRRDPRRP